MKFSLLLLTLFATASKGFAQLEPPANLADFPRSYICARATAPIVIDGKLDEGPWKNAPWTEPFVDIRGSSLPRPRFLTHVKMLWDDQCFYIGAELEEPEVWGTLTIRDTVIFYDNDFEVFVDPNGDNLEYIEMEMNALNTVWDLLLPTPYRDGGHAVDSFDIAGLRTAVSVQGTLNDTRDRDAGWTVEIALPWQAFAKYAHRPLPPNEGDQWRVNFSRVEWQVQHVDGKYQKLEGIPEDNWVWSPQGVIDMHRPERWGYVQFTSDAEVKFRTDPSWEARVFLLRVYYAQRAFYERFGRWAATFDELQLKPDVRTLYSPLMTATSQGYTLSVEISLPGGSLQRWHLSQDSRIWSE
jgi:hypothetical protein